MFNYTIVDRLPTGVDKFTDNRCQLLHLFVKVIKIKAHKVVYICVECVSVRVSVWVSEWVSE